LNFLENFERLLCQIKSNPNKKNSQPRPLPSRKLRRLPLREILLLPLRYLMQKKLRLNQLMRSRKMPLQLMQLSFKNQMLKK